MDVNGLVLPESLLRAVEAGRWPPVAPIEALNHVFPEEAVWPEFFTIGDIIAVNRSWREETRIEFVGAPGSETGLRTDRSLLIGELGPDQLIALSYAAEDDPEPSVMYLTGIVEHHLGATWVTVAAHVDALLDRLDEATLSIQ